MATTTVLSTGLMTELEVVNKMLRAVDIAPVTSITGTVDLEVESAIGRLSEINRDIQTMGWDFNTRRQVKYLRNVNNQVTMGTNILSIKPVDSTRHKDYTLRAGMIYDRTPSVDSNVLQEDPVLDIVELINFEDLPSAARTYISAKAVREHESFESADDTKREVVGLNEMNAWSILINDHSVMHDESIEDNPNVGSSIFGRA